MKPIVTRIRIAAPPAEVRAKVDFSSLASYKPTFIHSITLIDNSKTPLELVPGDKLRCDLDGLTLSATVATNTDSSFSWTGTIMGVLHGHHQFRFEVGEGGRVTEFFQVEIFTGALSWIMGDNFLARKIGQRASLVKSYDGFNADFKRWVEVTCYSGLADPSVTEE